MTKQEEMRVLITGASGFIGSYLTKRLLNEEAEVYVLNRHKTNEINLRLKDVMDKVRVLQADLRISVS